MSTLGLVASRQVLTSLKSGSMSNMVCYSGTRQVGTRRQGSQIYMLCPHGPDRCAARKAEFPPPSHQVSKTSDWVYHTTSSFRSHPFLEARVLETGACRAGCESGVTHLVCLDWLLCFLHTKSSNPARRKCSQNNLGNFSCYITSRIYIIVCDGISQVVLGNLLEVCASQ
jgi:hypothetical protein